MKRPPSLLPAVLALLACAAPARSAQEDAPRAEPVPEPLRPHGTAPIRFGDPEELAYDEPFFPGATHDPEITAPDAVLGQPHATRLSHHDEVVALFRRWAEESPRLVLERHGETHEGRELVHAVVTSPENHARLDEILAAIGRLHDPRGLADAEAERLVRETPAVAWLGYSIHGDELSGSDAALAVGHHLVASRDEDVERLLERLVVVIDPVMNPDGRERIVAMVEQSAGYTPNLDYASMHRGRWPWGRGNHYLFDLNRDWMAGTQPETRARWRTVLRFHPQLFVDAHEMGALDTFLFYPQEEPINPYFPPRHRHWHGEFAADMARAFDERGWAYYTREWADGWAPFYSDAWSSLTGAVGILYEQASTSGFPLVRASGRVLTYRESVHHHAVASMANLETLAERREEVLADFLANKRRNLDPETPGNDRLFVARPGPNADRERELLRVLLGQGVEVLRAEEGFRAANARGARGDVEEWIDVPAGSLAVDPRQPMGQIALAYLSFDPRMGADALREEREELEREGRSKMYDLTSWSLPHALDLDAWWCDRAEVAGAPVTEPPPLESGVAEAGGDATPFGWVVDGARDASVRFAVRAMERGLAVHIADEPFSAAGRRFPRGSLLVRCSENEGSAAEIGERVRAAAVEASVLAHSVLSGRSPDEGPDLGGGHFHLLTRPRVAVLSGAPVSPSEYGHLWHELDVHVGVPFSILDAARIGSHDLRRYDVLVLPPGSGRALDDVEEELATWVEGGGTLVACGDAAGRLTAGGLGLSAVTLRRDALDELELYATAARREREARAIEIDEARVWGDVPPEYEEAEDGAEGANGGGAEVDEEEDEWLRRFSPQGATLLADVDDRSWITAGAGERLPVLFGGDRVFLSRPPVRTPVRLAPEESLRLGGLVWPEARERIAESAWLAVERKGAGQVILFAATPGFRGYHRASARLFANAVAYGPALGADRPLPW